MPLEEPTCYINRQGRWAKMKLATQREHTCYVNRQGETQGPTDPDLELVEYYDFNVLCMRNRRF